MALTIRSVSFSDIGTLIRLNDEIQTLHAQLDPSFFKTATDPEELEEFFESILEKAEDRLFLAEENDEALGYVWFQVQMKSETPFTWPRRQIYIYQIGVLKAFRRRGVGSFLVARVEQEAQDAGIEKIVLDTWAINVLAQEFYRARGFSQLTIGHEKVVREPAAS